MEEPYSRILANNERNKMKEGRVTSSARSHIREAILEFPDLFAGLDESDRVNIFDPNRNSGQSSISPEDMIEGTRAIIRFVHQGLAETHDVDTADMIFEQEMGMSSRRQDGHLAIRQAQQVVNLVGPSIAREDVPKGVEPSVLEYASAQKEANLGHSFGATTLWTPDPTRWNWESARSKRSEKPDELNKRVPPTVLTD